MLVQFEKVSDTFSAPLWGTRLSNAGSISNGLIVVDLVKDPALKGSLTRSTTPVIDPALLAIAAKDAGYIKRCFAAACFCSVRCWRYDLPSKRNTIDRMISGKLLKRQRYSLPRLPACPRRSGSPLPRKLASLSESVFGGEGLGVRGQRILVINIPIIGCRALL